MKEAVVEVTHRIRERSASTRAAYLARVDAMIARPRGADRLGCANVAHAFAALPGADKLRIVAERAPNIGVVMAYNDMLSAHRPYQAFPAVIRSAAYALGATAQVARGVPTMCDGVTQGRPGMKLSLFSRDTIAMGTAIALPHDRFDAVLRPASAPFSDEGGLKLLQGNLGRAVMKVSSVPVDRHIVEAPAVVFDAPEEMFAAFAAHELDRDFVAVVRFQRPRANGMPELHKLTPPLGALQKKGFRVALLTDGRMSGASGQVPAAIHGSPEVLAGGPLGRVLTGDIIRLDAVAGALDALVDAAEWACREIPALSPEQVEVNGHDLGRELFAGMRRNVVSAEEGACTWL